MLASYYNTYSITFIEIKYITSVGSQAGKTGNMYVHKTNLYIKPTSYA